MSASGSRADPRPRGLRRGGLRRRLVIAFGSTSAALILATLIPLGFVLARSHADQYAEQQRRAARDAAAAVAGDPATAASEIATRYPAGRETFALLLDERGQPQTLVTDPGAFPDVPTRAPEIRRALAGDTMSRTAGSELGRRLFVAVPVMRGASIGGVVWVSAPMRPVTELDRRSWAALASIGAAAILLAALVAAAVSRTIARRLEAVAVGAERFAEGRFADRIEVRGDDEVAQLAGRLNEMAARIERAVARERDFAAAASHQLRTPLTAIKLRIEELRAMPPGDPTAAEYLEEMTQEVDRLAFLAGGLLTLAAAEGGGVPLEPLPARAALEQAIERLRPLARQNRIEIELAGDADEAHVLAPRGAFQEVVFNLLDNAVKYSPAGERVEVGAERSDGLVVITVADRGPGVRREEAEQVFEPFFRAPATRGTAGSGLGLTISRRLSEAAGASVVVEPRPGGGTLATVRWPAAPGA